MGNRSQVSPRGLPFIFISAQHPVPYNTWQLKENQYYKEVSDVESAPRTVPKTSCEPEQLSHGEKEQRAYSSDEIWVTKFTRIKFKSLPQNNQIIGIAPVELCSLWQ